MKTMRYYGRDLLLALALVAIVAGAACDGCRDEPEPMPEPVAEEPSRRDQHPRRGDRPRGHRRDPEPGGAGGRSMTVGEALPVEMHRVRELSQQYAEMRGMPNVRRTGNHDHERQPVRRRKGDDRAGRCRHVRRAQGSAGV